MKIHLALVAALFLSLPVFAQNVVDDTIKLAQGGVSVEVQEAWAARQTEFQLTASDIVRLKDGKVSDKVIVLLIHSSESRVVAPAATATRENTRYEPPVRTYVEPARETYVAPAASVSYAYASPYYYGGYYYPYASYSYYPYYSGYSCYPYYPYYSGLSFSFYSSSHHGHYGYGGHYGGGYYGGGSHYGGSFTGGHNFGGHFGSHH